MSAGGGARATWRVAEPEGAAAQVGERPVQALWALLAPSFRDVLLSPHRRADGDRIVWEWRDTAKPARPGPEDLRELRRRLRDAVEMFAADAGRRAALPDGLTAEALGDGVARALIHLTNGSDAALAEHAVRTERGWMLRSWGFARPSPAVRADEPGGAAGPSSVGEEPERSAPAGEVTPAGAARGRRGARRAWGVVAAALVLVAGAAGLWSCARETSAGAEPAPQGEESEPVVAAEPVRPRFDEGTSDPVRPVASGLVGGATREPDEGVFRSRGAAVDGAVSARENSGVSSRMPERAGEVAATPRAITGPVATMPVASGGKAGPPSRAAGRGYPALAVTAVRDGAGEAGVLSVSRGEGVGATTFVVDKNDEAGAGAAARAEGAAGSASGAGEAREERRAGSPSESPEFTEHKVEARAASPTGDEPAPLPGGDARRAAQARADTGGEAGEAEVDLFAPVRRDEAEAAAKAGGSDGRSEVASREEPAERGRLAFAATDMVETRRLHAAPWRLMLERDAPLPTRPYAGDGKAELREARIEAWERARASLPAAMKRTEARAGWVFAAAGGRTLAWRTGEAGAGGETSAEGHVFRVSWAETEKRDLDVWLADAEGRAVARVRRRAAGDLVELELVAAEIAARPWFAWRAGGGAADAAGLDVSADWGLSARGEWIEAEGPPGATRVRVGHARSGWALHGGHLPAAR